MDELMDSDSSQSDASEDGQIIDTDKKTEIIVDGFSGQMQMLDGRQDNSQQNYQQQGRPLRGDF